MKEVFSLGVMLILLASLSQATIIHISIHNKTPKIQNGAIRSIGLGNAVLIPNSNNKLVLTQISGNSAGFEVQDSRGNVLESFELASGQQILNKVAVLNLGPTSNGQVQIWVGSAPSLRYMTRASEDFLSDGVAVGSLVFFAVLMLGLWYFKR